MELFNSFSKIPKRHLLIYLLLLGLLPLLIVLFLFWGDAERLENTENYLEDVHYQAERVQKKQAANIAVQKKYQGADHFYIDKNLETLEFLIPEKEALQKLVENPNFIEDETTRKRLALLSSRQNRLNFAESNVHTTPFFKEVTETLLHPVEVNISDIKKILSMVEGQEIGSYTPAPERPQLLILDFKIDKKSIREDYEVFDLNMKVLKREFP